MLLIALDCNVRHRYPLPAMAKNKKAKKKAGKKWKMTAKGADRYALYESAVYDPDADLDFLDRVFRENNRPYPMVLREDFAGTCKLAAIWVDSNEERTAHCLDLDPEPLAYGARQHFPKIGDAVKRIEVLEENVLTAETPPADILTAFNFSYWIFKERAVMLEYFKRAYDHVKEGGAFVLDIQGGPDVQTECEETREEDGFYYVWRTGSMDAITGDSICSISFEFADGSSLDNAFVYDWRIWHLTELKDLLSEAGFERVQVYWEGSDEDGEGNGDFQLTKSEENEEAWIAYIVAWKTDPE